MLFDKWHHENKLFISFLGKLTIHKTSKPHAIFSGQVAAAFIGKPNYTKNKTFLAIK